jgi:hypothetical protein
MFETQINRGVKWLNNNKPDWLDSIETGELDLSEADHCVLGQLFDDYFKALTLNCLNDEKAVMLGFHVGDHSILEELGENGDQLSSILTEEWLDVIEKLKVEKEEARKAEKLKEYQKYDVVFLVASTNGKVLASKIPSLNIGVIYHLPSLFAADLLVNTVVKFVQEK